MKLSFDELEKECEAAITAYMTGSVAATTMMLKALSKVGYTLRKAAVAQQAQPEMPTREMIAKALDGVTPALPWSVAYLMADAVLVLFAPKCAGVEHDPDKKCIKCAQPEMPTREGDKYLAAQCLALACAFEAGGSITPMMRDETMRLLKHASARIHKNQ